MTAYANTAQLLLDSINVFLCVQVTWASRQCLLPLPGIRRRSPNSCQVLSWPISGLPGSHHCRRWARPVEGGVKRRRRWDLDGINQSRWKCFSSGICGWNSSAEPGGCFWPSERLERPCERLTKCKSHSFTRQQQVGARLLTHFRYLWQ